LARTLALRSTSFEMRDQRDLARSAAEEAWQVAVESKHHRLQLLTRLRRATVSRSAEELDSVALDARRSSLRPLVGPARLELARLRLDAGDPAEALTQAERAIEAATAIGQLDLLFQARHTAGRAATAAGKPDAALEHYRAALAAFREMRQQAPAEVRRLLIERPQTEAFAGDAGRLMAGRGLDEDRAALAAMLEP
jgi:tetratricopeptide (TPR) repeat protein